MTLLDALLAGVRCRCPNCGEAPLFVGYLTVRRHCEACGQDLSKAVADRYRVGDVFLAGDAAATITGASYSIDGGWTAQ